MDSLSEIYNSLVLEWEYGKYVQILIIFTVVFVSIEILKYLLYKRVQSSIRKSRNDIDDLVLNVFSGLGIIFSIFISFFVAIQFVDIGSEIDGWGSAVVFIVIVFYTTKTIGIIVNYAFKRALKAQREKELYDPTVLKILSNITRVLIWIVAILIVVQNFGYNVTTLLGGLGIAGIAVAFGLQSVLEDIFAFFTIYFDKPFKVGDFVALGDESGTIKKVGLKSTRIKTLRGEELVVSNKELTQARINNFKRMTKRRVAFDIGVDYSTSYKKLQEIPAIFKKVIGAQKNTEFSRTHFREFGEYALIFEVVYFIDESDYHLYMDIQEDINLAIVEQFEKAHILMAFPTQTVHLVR